MFLPCCSARKIVGLLALILLLTASVAHGRPDFSVLDQIVATSQACNNLTAVTVSIVKLDANDSIVQDYSYQKTYGFTNAMCQDSTNPQCVKATVNDKFCIGSITNGFTAMLLTQLLQNNATKYPLLIDTALNQILVNETSYFNGDPIAQYITVRDFLANRMPIEDNDLAWTFDLNVTRATAWKNIYTLNPSGDLAANFRTSYTRNNFMFAQAGRIIEFLGGKTWEEQIMDFYAQPLGMSNLSFFYQFQNAKDAVIPMIRASDKKSTYNPLTPDIFESVNMVAPGISICANTNDMTKYIEFILRSTAKPEDKIDRDAVKATMKPSIPISSYEYQYKPQVEVPVTTNFYGLGWNIGNFNGRTYVSHDGEIYGFRSSIGILPEEKIAVFVSAAVTDVLAPQQVSTDLVNAALELALEEAVNATSPFNLCPKKISRTAVDYDNYFNALILNCTMDSTYSRYAGRYVHPLFGMAHVTYNATNMTLNFQLGKLGTAMLCRDMNDTIDSAPSDFLSMMFVGPLADILSFNDPPFQVVHDHYWVFFHVPYNSAMPDYFEAFAFDSYGDQKFMNVNRDMTSTVAPATPKPHNSMNALTSFFHQWLLNLAILLFLF